MLRKRRFVAPAAALYALAALTGAKAQPATVGRALARDNPAVTTVNDYYPGYYAYGEGFYYGDGLFGLFEIPGRVIGGIGGLLTSAPGGAYYGGPYYSRPPYVSPYRGAYYNAYEGNPDYDIPYNGGAYYFSPRYGGREYRDDYVRYGDRGYFIGHEYRRDHGSYDRYSGDAYDRSRASYNADDDDD